MATLIIVIIFLVLASLLVWFLLSNDERGKRKPVGSLWIAAGFGVIGIFAAIFLEQKFIPSSTFLGTSTLGAVFLSAMGVGVIEESCKFLPLTLFIYKRKYFNEHMDGILYYAIAGLAFGIPENILYTLNFGSTAGIIRLFLTPVFHAATGSIVGYYLVRSKIDHKSKYKPVLAFIGAILIHGFYDFGLLSRVMIFIIISIAITLVVSVMLFILFMKAKELDKAEGLTVVGKNTFCRSCGAPNPEHKLYCSHCGNYA